MSAVMPTPGITSGNTGLTTSTTSVALPATSSRIPVISVDDYIPIAPATTARHLKELPEADSSNIVLQSEIFGQILNSNMTADGLRLLRDILEEQYVAAEKKQQDTKLKEAIRCRVEDTVENIVYNAVYKVPYPFKWAEDELKQELAIKKLQDDLGEVSYTVPPSR
jgi:lipid A disaccharide synthetase